MDTKELLAKLPYRKPFLFVDELTHIDENGVTGNYTFNAESDFYKGHFKDRPVTPGVLLTECMAQIGVVCLGLFLLNKNITSGTAIALTSTYIEFIRPVFPGEKVTVVSDKIYFRFNKLKCKVTMSNEAGDTVCTGEIAGMIIANE